jgi:PST family polysaccharide transporter
MSSEDPQQPGPEAPVAPALGTRAARGFFFVAAQAVFIKLVNLVGQVLLALFLVPADFGLITGAYTATTLIDMLQPAGLKDILTQRQARFRRWANPALWLSGAVGISQTLMMLAVAPVAAWVYGEPQIAGLIACLSVAGIIVAISNVPDAALQKELRFKMLSFVSAVTALSGMGISVLLAWLGFGAYAFAISWPACCLVRAVLLFRATRLPLRWSPQLRRWKFLIGDSVRLFFSRVGVTLIGQGDRIWLLLLHGKVAAGIYVFAFNLSMQTLVLLATALDSVLFPTLSKLQHEPARQRKAFLSSAAVLLVVGLPACCVMAGLSAPVLRVVFPAKWEDAIPVMAVLSVAMGFRLVVTPAQGMMRAGGRFAEVMAINLIGAAVFIVILGLATWLAPAGRAPLWAAVGSGLYFLLEGPVNLHLASRQGREGRLQGRKDTLRVFLAPAALGVILLAICLTPGWLLPAEMRYRDLAWIVLALAVCGLIYLPLVRLLAPSSWDALHGALDRFLARPGRSSAAGA